MSVWIRFFSWMNELSFFLPMNRSAGCRWHLFNWDSCVNRSEPSFDFFLFRRLQRGRWLDVSSQQENRIHLCLGEFLVAERRKSQFQFWDEGKRAERTRNNRSFSSPTFFLISVLESLQREFSIPCWRDRVAVVAFSFSMNIRWRWQRKKAAILY